MTLPAYVWLAIAIHLAALVVLACAVSFLAALLREITREQTPGRIPLDPGDSEATLRNAAEAAICIDDPRDIGEVWCGADGVLRFSEKSDLAAVPKDIETPKPPRDHWWPQGADAARARR